MNGGYVLGVYLAGWLRYNIPNKEDVSAEIIRAIKQRP